MKRHSDRKHLHQRLYLEYTNFLSLRNKDSVILNAATLNILRGSRQRLKQRQFSQKPLASWAVGTICYQETFFGRIEHLWKQYKRKWFRYNGIIFSSPVMFDPHVTAQKIKFLIKGVCGFGYIYWRVLNGKLHFLSSVYLVNPPLICIFTRIFNMQIRWLWLQSLCMTNPADLVSFTEEILDGKFHFLCSESFDNKTKN